MRDTMKKIGSLLVAVAIATTGASASEVVPATPGEPGGLRRWRGNDPRMREHVAALVCDLPGSIQSTRSWRQVRVDTRMSLDYK